VTWDIVLWGGAAILAWINWEEKKLWLWVVVVLLIVAALLVDPLLVPPVTEGPEAPH
jgi:hypothetical protein